MTEKVIVLIPAFEPSETLLLLLQQLKENHVVSLVIDDGSDSSYQPLFQKASSMAIVLHQPKNQGKGSALKTGFAYIKKHFPVDSIVVTADADGQHLTKDILSIAQKASRYPNALILGCRHFGKKVPLRSQLGNRITCFVFRLSTGAKISDTQTGLRAFCCKKLDFFLKIPGERYEYETNVLLECTHQKMQLIEEPISTVYLDDHNTGSHFRTIQDSFRIYQSLLKFSLSSFISFLIDYALYSLFSLATQGFEIAFSIVFSNIAARIISASFNFAVNRKYVFHDQGSLVKSAASYFLLAACILFGNTLLLNFFIEQLFMNRFFAKLVIELVFFLFSWGVQRFIIFRKSASLGEENHA